MLDAIAQSAVNATWPRVWISFYFVRSMSTNVTQRWATPIDIDVAMARGDDQADVMIHDTRYDLSRKTAT